MPVSQLQSHMSRQVAALTESDMVSPSDFVKWVHMQITTKQSGTDFTRGPLKEHLLLGAKWLPLKVLVMIQLIVMKMMMISVVGDDIKCVIIK